MKHRKEHKRYKTRDILVLALKNLRVGEELICTASGYSRMKERVDAFSRSRQDLRLAVIPWGAIRKIRRTV